MARVKIVPSPEPALVFDDRTVTYAELAELARGTCGALERAALDPEAPIAFLAEPLPSALILAFTLVDAGIPMLPLHPKSTASERARTVAHANAVLVEPRALDASGPGPSPTWLRGNRGALAPLAFVATSGSSGTPKLVELSRGAFTASARASGENLGDLPRDRWLLALPFAHVGGLSILTRSLSAQRTVVVAPAFDAASMLECIRKSGVTLASAVPAQVPGLFAEDTQGSLSSLRALLVGGAACPLSYKREARARGVPLVSTYGLTEGCSQIATESPFERTDPPGSDCGRVLAGIELRTRAGRIALRGPTLFSRYLGEPTRDPESFFVTEDLGELDERGRLSVHGRADEMLVSAGENVHPTAVEAVLLAHPAVLEAAVFGIPDERFGVVIAAALVVSGAPEPVLARLKADLELEVPRHAWPRRVVVTGALPKTPLGKVDRRRVARELAASVSGW